MIAVPWIYRLLALVLFIGILLAFEARKPPGQRHRLREYTFLLTMGIGGVGLGMGNDWITSTLSPAYFTYFKGIPAGENFKVESLLLGAQAGFAGAVVGAGILLIVNPKHGDLRQLWQQAFIPFVSAAGGGVIAGILSHIAQWPRTYYQEMTGLLTLAELHRFHTVWMAHIGLYAGAVIGIGLAAVSIRRAPKI